MPQPRKRLGCSRCRVSFRALNIGKPMNRLGLSRLFRVRRYSHISPISHFAQCCTGKRLEPDNFLMVSCATVKTLAFIVFGLRSDLYSGHSVGWASRATCCNVRHLYATEQKEHYTIVLFITPTALSRSIQGCKCIEKCATKIPRGIILSPLGKKGVSCLTPVASP